MCGEGIQAAANALCLILLLFRQNIWLMLTAKFLLLARGEYLLEAPQTAPGPAAVQWPFILVLTSEQCPASHTVIATAAGAAQVSTKMLHLALPWNCTLKLL